MLKLLVVVFAASAILACLASGARAEVSLSVDPTKVTGKIDEKIYGQFLEHIYHSVNGGLWGEMVWNRSFEDTGQRSAWAVEDGCVVQSGGDANVRLVFGDAAWKDYEFTLEAEKVGGAEGFLVLFRVMSKDDFYWANLGGWQNKRHGLERGEKGSRWHTVGKVADGSVETGKWCPIRVRCEGPRVQVWLDGQPVLDFTDDKPHLSGQVGIGTWSTQAKFRKIKVAALDGKVLFEGLPEIQAGPAAGHFWRAYGPGKVALVAENPLNGAKCVKIVAEGGETGLRQTPLCLGKGETYAGSLWARGEAADGLTVRLLDGEKVIAEKTLGKPEAEWKELAFGLKPEVGAENGSIQVAARGKAAVYIDQVSLMADASRKTGGFRPDLLKAIADLRPPAIRWPGGCYASKYRWKDGVGPQHKRGRYPDVIWDDIDVNSFGTDEFLRMCRAVGAEPLIVINVGMHAPRGERDAYCQEACDWLEYCNGPADSKWGKVRAANGRPEPYKVKFWEMDNEIWNLKPDDYTAVLKQFVPVLKKIDPSITILACGSGQLGHLWGEGDTTVIRECADLIDYLSVHHYEDAAKYADGPAAAEKFWRSLGEKIAASKNPKAKLYVSEWNAQSTDWRTGLYAGGCLSMFERTSDVIGLAGPALFLRHVSATAWDNAFINFDHRTWFPAPNYVVMKLWHDHFAADRLELAGDVGGLSAVATRSADGKKLFLKAVNATERPVDVRLEVKGDLADGRATLELVAPDSLSARNTLEKPDAVKVIEGEIGRDGKALRFTLPRWSAGVVTVAK